MAKKKFMYLLHHVDHGFAVYVRTDLQKSLSEEGSELQDSVQKSFSKWLSGWFCSPLSRYFSQLELIAGVDAVRLTDQSLPLREREIILCRVNASKSESMLESNVWMTIHE
jgi:hypothetical protein